MMVLFIKKQLPLKIGFFKPIIKIYQTFTLKGEKETGYH